MKKLLSVLMLISLAGTSTMAQQIPATPPKPTAPAVRTLTAAEQKQKDRVDREVQRERQIRAEWAQKQREYEAKQAEKERQRQAKKVGNREQPVQVTPARKPSPAPPISVPATAPAPTPQPAAPVPTVAEPTRKEKREKRKQEKAVEPAPPVPVTAAPETPAPEPVRTISEAPKPERIKREKRVRPERADTISTVSAGSNEPTTSRPSWEFLPKGHLFDPILLDPLEAQTYGSLLPMYTTEGKRYAGSIVPFAFGFAKPFYRRTTEPGRSEEWVLDLASFTQFEAYHDDKLNKARRQIVNNDYKVSIIYNVRRGANTYRFRVYHLSSHLADDYIYRNKLTAPTPNSVNYELLDVTYSRLAQNWRLYGGIGFVLRKAEERKLLSAQLGAYYKKPSDRAARLVGGVDIKFWQQTDFRPGIHGGVGLEIGRTQNNLTLLLEGYSGFRPYSQFEDQQTSWIGLGLYLNPF
ncbi:DUF1207 domain-containing protein [Spirosoma arcticum]